MVLALKELHVLQKYTIFASNVDKNHLYKILKYNYNKMITLKNQPNKKHQLNSFILHDKAFEPKNRESSLA